MEPSPGTSLLIQTAFFASVPENEPSEETVRIASLVQRISAGDSIAFEQFILRHERRILTLSIRLLGSIEDAQDAAQEVFLRTFKYIHRLDVLKPVEPWLVRMTLNVCRDMARKRQRRQHTFLPLAEPEAPADESSDPYTGFAYQQRERMLRTALNNLPEKERMAVILRDLEGMSTSEVAVLLRSSESTVRSQISRARLRMKEAIDEMARGQL